MAPLVDNPLIASATLHNPRKSPNSGFTPLIINISSASIFAYLYLALRYHLAHLPAILSHPRTI